MWATPSKTSSRAPRDGLRQVTHRLLRAGIVQRADDHQQRRLQLAQATRRGRIEHLRLALLLLGQVVRQDPVVDLRAYLGDAVGRLPGSIGPVRRLPLGECRPVLGLPQLLGRLEGLRRRLVGRFVSTDPAGPDDERTHAVGKLDGEVERDRAGPREADHVRGLLTKVIQQRRDVGSVRELDRIGLRAPKPRVS